ncbi:similar to Saccharomyces cerevisiae YBL107C MIX23 Putative protein of unknown function [Maudiozyma saulgeensis]|uniref:Mitochondrial intermembrane space cysteine motif-containing protein MIX23 n=1 Tax=Maudiozyma saulgeensis TaxID=1789683 RepID=A0A1X7R6P5_9SACH|nr:similar to Saccharomyces cerevisiae YBL107C MIX23 Putative protein of unknown function [Kazachstania saulgeensis]
MSEQSITVRAPKVFLESNLNFPNVDTSVTEVTVTRARCIDPSLLDSFLRTMRHGSDDIIKQKINNVTEKGSTLRSKSEKCGDFVRNELYPNWKERSKVIFYCQYQATLMKEELDVKSNEMVSDGPQVATRIDPYAERDWKKEQESRFKQWRNVCGWVQNNLQIESILRTTSEEILNQRCDANRKYLEDFEEFMNKQQTNK